MTRVVWCAFLFSCLAPNTTARAQITTIVIAPRSAFADALSDRLRAGLDATATGTDVLIADASTGCDPGATAASATAPASTTTALTILVAPNATVAICTRAHDTFTQRTVGPFAALDAAAVEQIATMVEASLEALATPTTTIDATATTTLSPLAVADPGDDTEAVAPNAPAENTEQPVTTRTPTAPNTGTTETPLHGEATDKDTEHDGDNARHSDHHARSRIALTLGAGPTLWDAQSIALDGQLGARYAMGPRWLCVALALTYGLPFERTIAGLGARFSIVAVDALMIFALDVSDDVVVDLALGPRAQWLFVRPFVVEGSNATAGNDSYAFNLSGVVEATPRIEMTRHLWLSATLGVVFASQPRAYGVDRGDTFDVILDQRIPRPYLRVGALLAL